MSHILVTGGSGTLGRHVVPRLLDAGCKVRVLSRSSRRAEEGIEYVVGNLTTGAGIESAVEEIEIILHCAGTSKGDEVKTQHLVQAASRVGVRRLAYISVVGADRIPVVSAVDRAMFGYFASKLASERLIAHSGIPWSILRATQFHDAIFTVGHAMAKLPIAPVLAGARFQPVDTAEVAARLVELTLGEPIGLAPEFGGPRIYTMAELLRAYLSATHQRRPLMPLWQPGQAARAIRAGANLTPDHADGVRTWEEYLADRLGVPQSVRA